MRRPALLLVAACMALLACSLSGSSPEAGSPTEQGTGGGVPISKSTTAPSNQPQVATELPSVQTATVQPVATSVPSTQPSTGSAEVEIIDLNVVADVRKLVGLAKNVSGRDLVHLAFTFTFYDSTGAVADERYGFGRLGTFPAGEITPFETYFPQGVAAEAETVSVLVEWRDDPSYPWTRDGLSLGSIAPTVEGTNYRLGGQVRNETGRTALNVNLVGVVFNAQGKLIDISITVVEGLSPGSSAPFSIPFGLEHYSDDIASFEVLAEARFEE